MKTVGPIIFLTSLFGSIRCSELVQNPKAKSVIESETVFEISDSCLGGLKNFGYKYLTMEIPTDRIAANDFGLKMHTFLDSLVPKCWKLKKLYKKESLSQFYNDLLTNYSLFKCQSLRRALIFGLISNFKNHYDQIIALNGKETRSWTSLGLVVADALEIVNEIIPENYFERNMNFIEETSQFTSDMYDFLAFTWTIDFYPLYKVLKGFGYSMAEPLTILIKRKDYFAASKVITSNEASVDPSINFPAWLAIVEADEDKEKLNFIFTLMRAGKFDINWTIVDLDFLQHAMLSKKDLRLTVEKIFSLDIFELKRSAQFYLEFAQSEMVSSKNSIDYQESLLRIIRKFI